MSRIFVTGSADGLAKMAAQLLIDQGHQVVLHARNKKRAQDALASVAGCRDGCNRRRGEHVTNHGAVKGPIALTDLLAQTTPPGFLLRNAPSLGRMSWRHRSYLKNVPRSVPLL
jgi:NAD(P)-dependent dehydrogenase (short-subunit alcohol dehydrogenase family)